VAERHIDGGRTLPATKAIGLRSYDFDAISCTSSAAAMPRRMEVSRNRRRSQLRNSMAVELAGFTTGEKPVS
jgi:hypothetical protein